MNSEKINMLMYMNAIENGETISENVESGKEEIDNLTDYDRLSLHSYQFFEYWLSRHQMKDISFMVCQFPWLSSGSGI